jgi:hypothetical protein
MLRLRITITIVFTSLVACGGGDLWTQYTEVDDDGLAWLASHATALDLANSNSPGFSALDPYLFGKKIIFAGERHGISTNSDLNKALLRYLATKANVNYYLAEMGYASAYFINTYLESGDESGLEELLQLYEGTYAYTSEYFGQWKALYQLNQELGTDRQIRVVGADVDHPSVGTKYLHSISRKEPPQVLEAHIAAITALYNAMFDEEGKERASALTYFFQDGYLSAKGVLGAIEANRADFDSYLGNHALAFEWVLENMIVWRGLQLMKDSRRIAFNQARDEQIYKNFLRLVPDDPDARFFGQWGYAHAFQKKWDQVDWFGARLEHSTDSPFRGQLLTILYAYDNATYLDREHKERSVSDAPEIIGPLGSVSTSDLTLFQLAGDASPFESNLYLTPTSVEGVPNEGTTTDYFQFCILVKNAPADHPYIADSR